MTPTQQATQLIQQHGPNAFKVASQNFDKYNTLARTLNSREQLDELLVNMKLSTYWLSVVTTIFYSNK